MYLKLDEKDLEIVKKVSEITNTDYELEGDMFPEDSIMIAFEDLKQDLHDNYRPLSPEELGWADGLD